MRPTRNDDLLVESNITGDEIAMSFDQNSLVHLMSVLTDLYSDPELAVIREYATNAFDSHVEAGQSRPIEVTLPSPLAPFFKVKDFGIGMSVEDIHNTYSKYGASTKRDTDDQVGTLGLGCKSALTYTNQFSLVGTKDGVRCQVAISRDETGAGKMIVVDTRTTDEPNGVEVLVPASPRNDFERKARTFFSFWEPGRVLVNDEDPSSFDGLRITDDIYVHEGDDTIVMGNVPYPANLSHGLPYGYGLVARVPIGAVNFTPSREALHYTARTKATLADLHATFTEAIPAALQAAVDEATSMPEALRIARRWQQVLPRTKTSLHYKGHPLPDSIACRSVITQPHSHVMSRHERKARIPSTIWHNSVWFVGYTRPTFTAGQKKKLNLWLSEVAQLDGWRPDNFILTAEMPPAEWLEERNVADWAEVEALKLPSNAGGRRGGPSRLRGSFDLWADGSFEEQVPADDINTDSRLFYVHGTPSHYGAEAALLSHFHPGCTLVCLPGNRVDKFMRDFPEASEAHAELRTLSDAWHESLPQDVRLAFALRDTYQAYESLSQIDPTKVDDPALREAAELAKLDIDAEQKLQRRFRNVGFGRAITADWENPLDSYPLANASTLRYYPEDSIIYLNAAYAARKDA